MLLESREAELSTVPPSCVPLGRSSEALCAGQQVRSNTRKAHLSSSAKTPPLVEFGRGVGFEATAAAGASLGLRFSSLPLTCFQDWSIARSAKEFWPSP